MEGSEPFLLILMIPYSWIYSVAPVSIVLMLVSYTEEKVRELLELFGNGKEGRDERWCLFLPMPSEPSHRLWAP